MSLKALQKAACQAHRPVPAEIQTLADKLWHLALTATAMGYSLDELAALALEKNGPYRAD